MARGCKFEWMREPARRAEFIQPGVSTPGGQAANLPKPRRAGTIAGASECVSALRGLDFGGLPTWG